MIIRFASISAFAMVVLVGFGLHAEEPDATGPFRVAQADPAVRDEPVAGKTDVEEQEEEEATGDISEYDLDLDSPSGVGSDPYKDAEIITVTGTASQSAGDMADATSVTEFNTEDIDALGAQNIADLANFTPNLEIVTTGATTPTFFIRGVGLNDFNANSTSAVSVYQNDVHVNSPGLQLGILYDVEAVNVLRGPQGYGAARNASAGAIKVYNKRPSGDFGGYFRADFGNYDFMQYEGAVEAPVWSDMLSMRLAGTFADRDGFMVNRCAGLPPIPLRPRNPSGQPTTKAPYSYCGEVVDRNASASRGRSQVEPFLPERVNDLHYWAGRATLLFEPIPEMSWLFIGSGSDRDQYTNLGQTYGTNGFSCLNNDIANCYGGNFLQIHYPNGTRIDGILGGVDSEGYVPIEVRLAQAQFTDCFQPNPPARPGCDNAVNQEIANVAKQAIAQELAKNLDHRPYEGDFNHAGRTTNTVWGASAKGQIEMPWGLSLTSVSAYDTYDRTIDIDLDFSPNTAFQVVTDDEVWQFYQDVTLHGDFGDYIDGFWDIGGYFLRENLFVHIENDFGGNQTTVSVSQREYTQDLNSWAFYFNASMDFWTDFTLDGGFRWNVDQKEIDYELVRAGNLQEIVLDDTWEAPTGSVRLTYRFRDDTSAFWKYTRGWKGGHYNATSSQANTIQTADPEINNAFEAGVRGAYFDGMMGLNLTFFYYGYDNYQIFTAQQFLGNQPEFVILNANDAEVYGAEAELVLQPWEGALADFRFGWLETQFLDFVQEQQTRIPNEQGVGGKVITKELQNSGNPLLNSPRFKLSMTLQQTFDLGRWGYFIPRYDGAWSDTTYFDATKGRGITNFQGVQFLPAETIAQPAYWLHNVRLAYRVPDGNVEVAFWVRNIANQTYRTFAFDGSTFNNTSIYFLGNPRTFGGSVSVNF